MKKTLTISTAMAVLLILLDQIIKRWAMESLLPAGSIRVIPGLFNLTYVENRGAAFGILQGNTVFLSVVTGVVMACALIYIFSGRIKEASLNYIAMLIVAGGIGNFIDRVFRGYVVDYLDFSAIFGFPVFNLADCCVVIGTSLLLIHVVVMERRGSDKSGENPEPGE